MSIKKIFVISTMAIFAWVIVMPLGVSAATVNRSAGLGSLFTLDKLFDNPNSNLLSSGKTSAGDLFILNQLFPIKTAAVSVSLASQLSGRILLQVQQNGEAWYVNPVTKTRVSLGSPSNAFMVMSDMALGISNADFAALSTSVPSNVVGRFIIKTGDAGKLYYVDPVSKSVNFIGGPDGAANVIDKFGLGITDANLDKITVAK